MRPTGKLVSMEGRQFGDLVVLRRAGRQRKKATWWCRCACGRELEKRGDHLRAGNVRSCGVGHNFSVPTASVVTAEYQVWRGMLARCCNPKSAHYKSYGERGIRVCKRWRADFENFLLDMGPRPTDKHSIDRYPDNDGDYEPTNCRWATQIQQQRNTRKTVRVIVDGKAVVLAEYAEKMGVDRRVVLKRLKRGWTLGEAVTVPKNPNRHVYPDEWLTGVAFKRK